MPSVLSCHFALPTGGLKQWMILTSGSPLCMMLTGNTTRHEMWQIITRQQQLDWIIICAACHWSLNTHIRSTDTKKHLHYLNFAQGQDNTASLLVPRWISNFIATRTVSSVDVLCHFTRLCHYGPPSPIPYFTGHPYFSLRLPPPRRKLQRRPNLRFWLRSHCDTWKLRTRWL